MKNIYEILKEYGLEVPADKKADFDKAWKENYRTKSEYDNAVLQRDNYKTSLDDVKLFGGKYNTLTTDRVYGEFLEICSTQVKSNNAERTKIVSKYRPNRAQRRAKK